MSNKLTFIDLFAGIGGFRIAFKRAGCECVFASEKNKFSRHTYSVNFLEEEIHWRDADKIEDHPELFGDIRDVNAEEIPDFNILAAGFPCPTFSIAGISKRKSLGWDVGLEDDDKGKLFFEIARILREKQPEAFLLENVKNLTNINSGETFELMLNALHEDLGYDPVTWKIFDAAKLVPQHRERVLIAGFRKDLDINFDLNDIVIEDREPQLQDILQPPEEVPKEYSLSDDLWEYLQDYKEKHRAKGNGFGYSIADPEGITRTMSARYHKDGSEILIEQPGDRNPRMLTEREAARLFGYPEDFKISVSKTQAYQQFGNTVAVPVVARVAKELSAALKEGLKLPDNDEATTQFNF